MNKKTIIIFFLVLVLGSIIVFTTVFNSESKLIDCKLSNVKEIRVFDNASEKIFTDSEEFERIIDYLNSIDATLKEPDDVDGFAYLIDITYNDGTTTPIVLRGNAIVVDEKYYSISEEASDGFKVSYNK